MSILRQAHMGIGLDFVHYLVALVAGCRTAIGLPMSSYLGD